MDAAAAIARPPVSEGSPTRPSAGAHSLAPAPFDKPTADVVLRTADNVVFRVRSHILLEASPILESKLASLTPVENPTAVHQSPFLSSVPPSPVSSHDPVPSVPPGPSSPWDLIPPSPIKRSPSPEYIDPRGFAGAPPEGPLTPPLQPTGTGTPRAQVRVLDLPEHSKVVEILLRICYPILNPPLDMPLADIGDTLRAAIRYEMVLPIAILGSHLIVCARDAPIPVWALACRLGLEDVARGAAEHLLAQRTLAVERDEDLRGVTSGQYFRLREFWRVQGKVDERFQLLSAPELLGRPAECCAKRTGPFLRFEELKHCDLVCCASDGLEFRVHTAVVSAASAVLRLQIPPPRIVKKICKKGSKCGHSTGRCVYTDDPCVLHLEEDGQVIGTLLELCYWGDSTLPLDISTDIFQLAPLMAAALKYKMQTVTPLLRTHWSMVARCQPLQAYLCAVKYGLTGTAAEAAKTLVQQSFDGLYDPELENTPALAYHRLVAYYNSCRAIAHELLSSTEESTPSAFRQGDKTDSVGVAVGDSATTNQATPAPSADDWFAGLVSALAVSADAHPGHVAAASDSDSVYESATSAGQWCPTCQPLARKLSRLSGTLRDMSERIAEVEFVL
ncbi:hypothetical protein BD413DRAFT_164228 [Trametes elegans]|nr:hypothetical protein BD413DRAFT_164228 [Trametes elegans]